MVRTTRLSNVNVFNKEPKHGNIVSRATSNVGVQKAVINENHTFVSSQKGRMAERPIKTSLPPTISQDRNVRQISYDTPLPHPQPNPIVSQLTSLNQRVAKQNLFTLAKNPSLLQKDMSIVTDEQVTGNELPEPTMEQLKKFRALVQKAGFETAKHFGADIGDSVEFARDVADGLVPAQRRNLNTVVDDIIKNQLPGPSRSAVSAVKEALRLQKGSSALEQKSFGI